MQVRMIGLGRMGANMARRLRGAASSLAKMRRSAPAVSQTG